MKVMFGIDLCDGSKVAGWAYSPDFADERLIVSFYDSSAKKICDCIAGIFREDLLKGGIGDGKHAFAAQSNFADIDSIKIEIPYKFALSDYKRDLDAINIHIEDQLFAWSRKRFGDEAINYYLSDGKKCADQIRLVCTELFGHDAQNVSLLEFASGFGRVTRYLGKH